MAKGKNKIRKALSLMSNMISCGDNHTVSSDSIKQTAYDCLDNLYIREQLEDAFDVGFRYNNDLNDNKTKLSPMEYLDKNLKSE